MKILSKVTCKELLSRSVGLYYLYGKKVEILSINTLCKFKLDNNPTIYSFNVLDDREFISLTAEKGKRHEGIFHRRFTLRPQKYY